MSSDDPDLKKTPGEDRPNSAVPRKPHKFSKPGWKEALKRTKKGISEDHLTIVAAGVAFYLMLGIVPALAGLISIYGLVSDPSDIQEHFASVEGAVPSEASELLKEQMDRIAEEETTAGWGAFLGIVLALWAGSRATKAMMKGLNITYNERESRGFIKVAALGFALTVATVFLGLIAIGIIVILPPLLEALPLSEQVAGILSIARWPLLLLVGILGITMLYNLGPSRDQPGWRWLTWGSATAALLWIVVSGLFSFYVSNFADYNETYGSLGAVVILLLWLHITAFVILLGAELDASFEVQTRKDVLPGTGEAGA